MFLGEEVTHYFWLFFSISQRFLFLLPFVVGIYSLENLNKIELQRYIIAKRGLLFCKLIFYYVADILP